MMNDLKEKRKKSYRRIGIVIFCIIMLFILIWQIAVNRTETQIAVKITQNDSFQADGWFFRKETVVEDTKGDIVKHIVQNGEKVQKNASLAVVYSNSQAFENSQKASVLQDQIELLNNASQMLTSTSDSIKIESMITAKISELSVAMQQSTVSNIQTIVKDLRDLSLRRGLSVVDSSTLSAQIQKMESELNYLNSQIGNSSITISSPTAGFFSEVVDGFESKLTIDSLNQMTVSELEKLNRNDINSDKSKDLGKIVQDFRWYFAMSVPKNEVEDLSVGGSLSLRFAQLSNDIPVTISDIRKNKSDENALLIVSSMEITPEILSMRYQSVEVIKATYKGIKVPKSAVRVKTDNNGNSIKGVFILPNSVSRFKPIEVLYETKDYYVVKQGTTNENTGIVVGDKIIVKGRDLQDLKVIK